jgi:UMF1 family MFS transporter
MSLYDAYLTRIAAPENVGRVSGFGWAVGFAGGIAAVLLCMALLQGADVLHDRSYTVAFGAIALLFAVAAAPAIIGLRRIPEGTHDADAAPVHSAAARVLDSIRSWRGHGNVVRFLAAIYLINDAVVTVGFFAGIYFREHFGLGLAELLQLILLYHVLAAPATLAFGHLCDRVSAHAAIYTTLAIWIAAVLLMAFGTGPYVPAAVVALFATVLGSTQALLRGAYAVVVPRARAAEFFGFNAFASRLSAAAGPLAYGLVSAATGSQQIALLSVLVFLLAGAIVLATVRLQEPSGGTESAA